MQQEVYLYLFILCAVLSQGIFGKFLEDDIDESSNLLVREKRVINRKPGGDVPVPLGAVPYVVNIKKGNRLHCIGSILSVRTVITAARCMAYELSMYSLFSSSRYSYRGLRHNVTKKMLHGHSPSRAATFLTGIALVTVDPPFVYSDITKAIRLHTGPTVAGIRGTISGWGAYYYGGSRETDYSKRLRSITVPIMNHRDCVNIYKGFFEIREEDICTYHMKKQCGYTDAGAPFVIDGELAAVHIGVIETRGTELIVKPDVFALLQYLDYARWIRENIE